jgi:hypothetical protein
MTNKSYWSWLVLMSFIISSQTHSTGSNCLNPKKHLLNSERWESPPPLAIWWLHFLAAVCVCHADTHGHFWGVWFCVYQFLCCGYCGNFGQAIMWEWTVPMWIQYVNHFTVSCLLSILRVLDVFILAGLLQTRRGSAVPGSSRWRPGSIQLGPSTRS